MVTRPVFKVILAGIVGVAGGSVLVLVATGLSPLMGAALFVGLVGAVLIFLYPMLGLYLCAAVIPMERLGRFTDDISSFTISLMRIVGMLTLASFLLHAISERRKIGSDPAFNLYAIYWAFGVVALFFTTDLRGSISLVSAFLGNLLFMFIILNMAGDWRTIRRLVEIWLVSTVVIGIWVIYDWYFGSSFDETRLGITSERFDTVLVDTSEWASLGGIRRTVGPTSNPAVYGINLIMAVPFLLFFVFHARNWRIQAAAAGGTLVVLYNIMLTNTRATILLTGLLLILAVFRRLARVSIGGFFALAVLGSVSLYLMPETMFERIFNPSNYTLEKSGTLRIRLEYWGAGLDAAVDNWLTGAGLGNRFVIADRLGLSTGGDAAILQHTAHNEFITTFIEVGVFGWVIMMTFIGLVLRYSFKAASIFRADPGSQEQYWFMVASQLTMISVLVFGLQVDVLHFPLKGWWLVVALTCVMHRLATHAPAPAEHPMRTDSAAPSAGASGLPRS